MDFYFAGSQHETSQQKMIELDCNILKSYYNDRSIIRTLMELKQNAQWKGKLLVDSGAYTCWTKGIKIDVDKYIDWINENNEYIDYCIQLDTIPGSPNDVPTLEQARQATEESWQNYLYMTERVTCPEKILPVYHKGEPLEHLKNIVEHQINGKYVPYICLGGSAKDRHRSKLIKWYHTCLDVIHNSKNPNVKIHVLGQSILSLLETLPFTSCDSTSWIMTGAVGNIMTDYGTVLVSEEQKNNKDHITHKPIQLIEWVDKKCKQYGIDYADLQSSYKFRSLFNVNYIYEWSVGYTYKGHKSFSKRTLF